MAYNFQVDAAGVTAQIGQVAFQEVDHFIGSNPGAADGVENAFPQPGIGQVSRIAQEQNASPVQRSNQPSQGDELATQAESLTVMQHRLAGDEA